MHGNWNKQVNAHQKRKENVRSLAGAGTVGGGGDDGGDCGGGEVAAGVAVGI
jgi:hypothetical protein